MSRRSLSYSTKLTPRELEVLSLVGEGLRDKDIAEQLGIETVTVKKHSANIKIKCGMCSKLEMALWAIHNELIDSHVPKPDLQEVTLNEQSRLTQRVQQQLSSTSGSDLEQE